MADGVREIMGVSEVVNLYSGPQNPTEQITARLYGGGASVQVRVACSEKAVGLSPDQARHFARCLVRLARAAESGE